MGSEWWIIIETKEPVDTGTAHFRTKVAVFRISGTSGEDLGDPKEEEKVRARRIQ